MDADTFVKVMGATTSLVQALAWPLLLLIVVLNFRVPLKKFLGEAEQVSFKAGASGIEATLKKQGLEAAAALGAATIKSVAGTIDGLPGSEQGDVRRIADVVSQAVAPTAHKQIGGAHVLWVDDNPQFNIYERRALEALGVRFDLSQSTEDALEKLRSGSYDVIVSDMSRPLDERAGYTLLEEKVRSGNKTPLIIYASKSGPKYEVEAQRRGAFGQTNVPQTLFQLVLSAIQSYQGA